MELKQERHLPLPRQTVWDALNDPEVLQACIPGCEAFDRVDDSTYEATVKAKIGPVSARFKGQVSLEDLQPPEAYSMSFQGQGGQAGFVKGSAAVMLDEAAGGCTVGYTATAQLGGKLAQLGSRLVDGAARKTADDFFDNFVEHMGGSDEAAGDDATASADDGSGGRGVSTSVWPWVAAGVGVVLLLLALTLL